MCWLLGGHGVYSLGRKQSMKVQLKIGIRILKEKRLGFCKEEPAWGCLRRLDGRPTWVLLLMLGVSHEEAG